MKNCVIIDAFAAILLMLIATTPFSISALTTFGKTNPQNQYQPTQPPTRVGNARDCKMESDCTAIQNTSCLADRPQDGKTRCLCGDYSPPVNGRCRNKGKAVDVPCNDDSECHEGAECIGKDNGSTGKKCSCKEGYYEENYMCNGAEMIFGFRTIGIMTLTLIFVQVIGYST